MVRLLISTGEVSGDLQGSLLIHALKAEALRRGIELEILALGGPRMKAAGAELIADTAPMGAIGLWEAVPLILPTLRLQAKVDRLLAQRPPDAVVLIDYVGANARLGTRLRKLPSRRCRSPITSLPRNGLGASVMAVRPNCSILRIRFWLFFLLRPSFMPSVERRSLGLAIHCWIVFKICRNGRNLVGRLGLDPDAPVLLLVPASRPQELRYLMPALARAAAMLQQRCPGLQVLVPAGLERFEQPLAEALAAAGVRNGRVIPAAAADGLKKQLAASADVALGKSGTVNLELALQGVPQVVGYRVSRATAFVARHVLRFQCGPYFAGESLAQGALGSRIAAG